MSQIILELLDVLLLRAPSKPCRMGSPLVPTKCCSPKQICSENQMPIEWRGRDKQVKLCFHKPPHSLTTAMSDWSLMTVSVSIVWNVPAGQSLNVPVEITARNAATSRLPPDAHSEAAINHITTQKMLQPKSCTRTELEQPVARGPLQHTYHVHKKVVNTS